MTPDGRARVSIVPKGNSNDDAVLTRFIDAVTAVAPDATGTPIGIREGGAHGRRRLRRGRRAVVRRHHRAAASLVLRRVRDVAITMAPIVLTGLLTLGSCVVIGQPLNFANIIALPLLFGIGVAFHIYFVMSWRSGGSHLLTSSLARAVFFSALTTATGFGSLWLSSHPGTASMGKLLMISLVWTLVSALIFQPALMGAPPQASREPDPEPAEQRRSATKLTRWPPRSGLGRAARSRFRARTCALGASVRSRYRTPLNPGRSGGHVLVAVVVGFVSPRPRSPRAVRRKARRRPRRRW